ncbi:MAG TPA: TonB family protein [Vicinamibacterales bacterium]|nr:TonB family protein [Vicinamibacterales bacterium]
MPLFDHSSAPARPNRRPLGTVSLSILLHLTALAGVIGLQFTSIGNGPQVVSRLRAFVVDPPLPKAPPLEPRPAPTAPQVAVNQSAAPLQAPLAIEPEPPTLSVPTAAGVPGLFPPGHPALTGPPERASPEPATTPAPLPPQRVGGDIRPPARITYVPPAYPDIARIAHVEGQVVLEATIDEWGVVQNIVVRKSIPLLDRAAIDAVSRWRYAPTRLNGQPVAIIMMVTVTFKLQN